MIKMSMKDWNLQANEEHGQQKSDQIESVLSEFFEKCEFNDECDECGNSNREQSWARMSGCYEYPDEVEYYVCQTCALNKIEVLRKEYEFEIEQT